jgi:aryl-alcohol dehydrogenase-like predicted oxidoreductase
MGMSTRCSRRCRSSTGTLKRSGSEHATGVIAYSPLQSGLLSGAMTAERVDSLPIDDWRASHPEFTGATQLETIAVALEASGAGEGPCHRRRPLSPVTGSFVAHLK